MLARLKLRRKKCKIIFFDKQKMKNANQENVSHNQNMT